MSTIQNNQASWTSLAGQQLDPKYEKCRNITEEIYKRINITFQIKKLENGDQSDISDNSEQIDSNELSNETDLFACDKSDISSSTEAERAVPPVPVLINNNNNNNNNEERAKTAIYKRPRKRFRKRVKKRAARARSASEGSSDEAPLARALLLIPAELKPKPEKDKYMIKKPSDNLTLRELLKPDDIKVPTVIIEKIKSIDKEAVKRGETTDRVEKSAPNAAIATAKAAVEKNVSKDKSGSGMPNKDKDASIDKSGAVEKVAIVSIEKRKVMSTSEERKKYNKDVKVTDWKSCDLCSLSFRGERGLRRHMSMSHVLSPEGNK